MISTLTIIIIFCLINYYIKKDLFTATVLGLSLTFIYFMISSDFSLNILFYKKNLNTYFILILYTITIISFKVINDKLNYSYLKDKIQDIFDGIFHEKKIKFLFLCIVSSLIYITPVTSIVLLIFLSIFLRISKYNLIVVPFVLVSTFTMYNEIAVNLVVSKGFGVLFLSLSIIYIELFIFLGIERYRKLGFKIKDLIIDYSFYGILFAFNTVSLFVLYNVIEINQVMLLSMVLTLALGIYLVTRFKFLLNQEDKENKNQDINKLEKLQELKLPYLIMFIFIISYVIGYLIFAHNVVLGLTFYLFINIVYSNLNQTENTHKFLYEEYIKFITIVTLTLINLILLKEIIYVNSASFENLLDSYLLNHTNFFSIIIIVQNYIFFPIIDVSSKLSNFITNDNVALSKLLLSIKIQMIISFINIYIVSFVFKIKKQELLTIVTMLLVFSFILQLIVYSL